MKHNIKTHIIAVSALCLAMATGCDNSQYTPENLYPEEYHKIISFQDDAISTDVMKIYDINIDITQYLSVLRGGSDPSMRAVARLRPMTAEEADIYLTVGEALDPQYYSIPEPEIVLEPEERYKKVKIEFSADNIAGIRSAMSAAPGTTFCLALMLDGLDGTEVNAGKSYFVREIELGKPEITITGGTLTDNADFWSVELSAMMDGDNLWDFDCQLFRDDSYIEDYNFLLGREYNALPDATNVTLTGNGSLNFVKEDSFSKNSVTLTVSKDGFDLNNAPYVLPIAMNMGELDFELASPYYMVIEGQIVLTEDMIDCPFDLTGIDGQGVAGLVDGNYYDTYWQSPYPDSGQEYMDDTYGHYFDINIGKEITQMKCEYYNRPAGEYITPNFAKDVQIYISNDGKTWTLFQERTDIPEDESPVEFGPYTSDTPFSHIRFCVKKNQQDMKPGIDPGACTHMSEFLLFGI